MKTRKEWFHGRRFVTDVIEEPTPTPTPTGITFQDVVVTGVLEPNGSFTVSGLPSGPSAIANKVVRLKYGEVITPVSIEFMTYGSDNVQMIVMTWVHGGYIHDLAYQTSSEIWVYSNDQIYTPG